MMVREAYISGIGISEVGIRLTRSPLLLTVDAVKAALADAELTPEQIDGVSTYPGKMLSFLGFSPVGSEELIEAMGLKTRWHAGTMETTAQLGAIAEAAMAVKSGAARHVICFRTVYEAAALAQPEEFPPLQLSEGVTGSFQWLSPFGAYSAACWTAQFATRHMKNTG
jgi:acetyl-CoA acetyltransferase